MEEVDIGQSVRIEVRVRDDAGALANPATLDLTVRKPDGSTVAYALGDFTHAATGVYRVVLVPADGEQGDWWFRHVSTSPSTAGEDTFTVRRSVVLGGPGPRQQPSGVCSPWAELGDLAADLTNVYDYDPAVLEDALQAASDMLYDLTGRRWGGECADVVRPCGPRSAGWCGCVSARDCGCRRVSEVKLPGSPVRAIQSVKIDGVAVSSARYRVDDGRWLVYLPESSSAPRQGWPCCQRVDLADTEVDTWSVSYTFGQPPPVGGVRAAASLAGQLARAWIPALSGTCKLPQRVTTVARQGVSMTMLDPQTFLGDGLTGLADVDQWVAAVRYGAKNRSATVTVPGRPSQHRRVG